MKYILGIDGGGSTTTAVLADGTGKVVGAGQGGASNYQTIGLETACDSLSAAIMAAIDDAGVNSSVTASDLEANLVIMLGLAGADRPWDKARLQAALKPKLPIQPAQLLIENDARIALAGAAGNRPGIILIAGTGSIALGIDQEGRQVRAGGWGPILGDEGSGYSIGRAALTAILREYDGRGRPTSLTKRVLSQLDITNPEELIPLVYQGPLKRPKIARLAEVVLDEASQGDPVSQYLITTAAQELVDIAGAVIKRLGWSCQPTTIAGTGGLLRPGNPIWKAIIQILAQSYAQSSLVPPLLPPVLGAILLGKAYLSKSSPHPDFMRNLRVYFQIQRP
ncbi:MAG: ATPase [Firmicutes bacterium]|nr:ATPase [Bacillota bacterium]